MGSVRRDAARAKNVPVENRLEQPSSRNGTQTSGFVQVWFVKLMGFKNKHENVGFELATFTFAVMNLGFELATSTVAVTNLGFELATSALKTATQPTTLRARALARELVECT